MVWTARGFVAGVIAAAWLPPWGWLLLLSPCVLVPRKGSHWLFAAAAASGIWHFDSALTRGQQLTETLHGDVRVAGRVLAFPKPGPGGVSFSLRVDGMAPVTDVDAGMDALDARIRLFWPAPAPVLHAGDRVEVEARLEPLRGLANPGGFDTEGWAFANGLSARGYVRSGASVDADRSPAAPLDRLRSRISESIQANFDPGHPAARLLPALAVADRRALSDADRAVLMATGTMHLLAISGLHVGLVAALGAGVGWLLWPCLGMPRSRRGFSFLIGLAFALPYVALAGFGLSTQRALAMLLGAAAGWWSRGRVTWTRGLTFAAAGILALSPAAVASAAFWLSFGAVACIAVALGGYHAERRFSRVLRAQAGVFLGLRPIAAAFGLSAGWTSPIVNLVAIPWVGWLVVPPLLIACLPMLFGTEPIDLLLELAGRALALLHDGLTAAAGLAPSALPTATSAWTLALMLGGAGLLLLPGALGLRLAGLSVLVVTLWRPVEQSTGRIDLHVLDVGQGLALVLEADGRRLLYDAGPRSRTGWSAGADVVLPFLVRGGRSPHLDAVVLSHGDLDHAGGWPAVREGLETPPTPWAPTSTLGRPCLTGMGWRWGRANFHFLHPDPGLPDLGNDSSCVLLVEIDGQRLLLPGDVSAVVEERLTARTGPLAVLIAAHHGSASSSSEPFISATRPAVVVFSHGFGNRFGMPRPEITDRFSASHRLSTAACGYLHLRIDRNGVQLHRAERPTRQRPWHPRRRDDGVENQYDCAARQLVGPASGPIPPTAAAPSLTRSDGA